MCAECAEVVKTGICWEELNPPPTGVATPAWAAADRWDSVEAWRNLRVWLQDVCDRNHIEPDVCCGAIALCKDYLNLARRRGDGATILMAPQGITPREVFVYALYKSLYEHGVPRLLRHITAMCDLPLRRLYKAANTLDRTHIYNAPPSLHANRVCKELQLTDARFIKKVKITANWFQRKWTFGPHICVGAAIVILAEGMQLESIARGRVALHLQTHQTSINRAVKVVRRHCLRPPPPVPSLESEQ